MKTIDDLYNRLFEYYLITDNSYYKVRLKELSLRIEKIKGKSYQDVFNTIINELRFFPTVADLNIIFKGIYTEKSIYEEL